MIQKHWELLARYEKARERDVDLNESGLPVPSMDSFDRNSVHVAFFDRPTEMNTAELSQYLST